MPKPAVMAMAATSATNKRKRSGHWRFRRQVPLYMMLLPCLVFLALFNYYPMHGIVIAFQNYKPLMGIQRSPFVGLQNFERLFSLHGIGPILRNTVLIAIGKIVLRQTAALVLALLLNELLHSWFKRLVQSVTYLLHFLSWIVFGGILLDILLIDGLVNGLLHSLGLPRVPFLTEPATFPLTLIITDVWKEFGLGTVLYLAALTAINPMLYEAAAVDGANRWQRLRHVTIPGITPTIVLLACLALGEVLDAGFEQNLVLQNAQVLSSGEIIDTFVYKAGLLQFQYSLATAVGLFKGAVSLVLITLSYYLADRLANYRIF